MTCEIGGYELRSKSSVPLYELSIDASHPVCYPCEDEVTIFLAKIDVGLHLSYCNSLQEL